MFGLFFTYCAPALKAGCVTRTEPTVLTEASEGLCPERRRVAGLFRVTRHESVANPS